MGNTIVLGTVAALEDVAKRNGTTITRMRNAVLRTFDAAEPLAVHNGTVWYPSALAECRNLAEGTRYSTEQVAAAVAHLSPRMPWSRNIACAASVMLTGTAPALGANVEKANRALVSDNPESTFASPKTFNFYRNIIGDTNAVTVDVWAARIALGLPTGELEKVLGRKGMYEAVAHAYRLAAKRRNIAPSEMQAITWCAIRGTHL